VSAYTWTYTSPESGRAIFRAGPRRPSRAGGFQGPGNWPTPPSNQTPLGRRCAFRASWSPRCKISLPLPSFRTEAHATVLSTVVRVAWSSAVVTDLQAKVQKYETKAAQCEESARQATDGAQRAFYEGLAQYYGKVATDFRHVIEKRKAAQLAVARSHQSLVPVGGPSFC
jgi:hypothetical protein